MRISHFQAIADILLGDAASLARGYHAIIADPDADFATEDARRRCAIAINAVGLAVDPDRYRAALEALGAQTRVEPICDRCGSADVFRDASAEWDCATQQWVLAGVYDSTTCQVCEAESDTLCDWRPCASETGQSPVTASVPAGDADAERTQQERTSHD